MKFSITMLSLIICIVFCNVVFSLDTTEFKISSSDAARGDWFGFSVSISGDTAIVAAPSDDDGGGRSGSAYIYKRNGNTWIEQQKLTASDGVVEDLYGHAVSISDDMAIVGAPLDDDMGHDSGSAYIYKRNGNTWIEQQKITASDGAGQDLFGNAVAISGDMAIVASPSDNYMGGDSGSAYIFELTGNKWTEKKKLIASDRRKGDAFGISVGISGDLAIVGANFGGRDGSPDQGNGSAYIFKRNGGNWTEEQKLTASDGSNGDQFGMSVSISNGRAVVGADRENAAYIFAYNGNDWVEKQKLTSGGSGNFGRSVSIDNDTAIVSCPDDGISGGYAIIFEFDGSKWFKREKIAQNSGMDGDHFGRSVSIDDSTAIAGVPQHNFFRDTKENGLALIYTFGVSIPDPNLRAALEEALGKNEGDAITKEDLAGLETFQKLNEEGTPDKDKIKDISGLEYCVNLKQLNLGWNQISNIDVLSNLSQLKELKIWENKISDISVLSKLINLTSLGISGNSIEDISVLPNFSKLTELGLGSNRLRDISALANLIGLTALYLQYNQISDISSLANLTNLTGLSLYDNQIKDISALSNLGNLSWLYLNGNQIIGLEPLRKLTALENLKIFGNPISDLEPLSNLLSLKDFAAHDNPITDLSGLSKLTALSILNLADCKIKDLSPLSNLTSLTELQIRNNQVRDISPILGNSDLSSLFLNGNPLSNTALTTHIPALKARGINVDHDEIPSDIVTFKDTNLEKAIRESLGIPTELLKKEDLAELKILSFSGDGVPEEQRISDLTGIEHCINLVSFKLTFNPLSDLSNLSQLTNLTELDLYFNQQLKDLTPLSGLSQLTKLNVANTLVSDISPLSSLTNLTWLDLWNDPVVDITPLSDLTNLTELYLVNNKIAGGDISPLTKLTRLENLGLGGNQIKDLQAFSNFTSLKKLMLDYNPITNLSGLEDLKNLIRLEIRHNQVIDVSPLSGLTNLEVLYLDSNQIVDVSPLSGLVNLSELFLYNNQIKDLTPLSNLNIKWRLYANDNLITDVSFLVENEISKEITLQNNPLSNTALSTQLPVLIERDIKIEYDEPPIDMVKMSDSAFEFSLRQALSIPTEVITKADTAGIVDLNMANTGVINIDLEVLKSISGLKAINLADNPLSRDAVLVQIPTLESTGIKVNLGTSAANLVELAVEKEEIPASQAATQTITVTVKDASERLVKREVVTLAVDKGTIQEVADNQGDGTYTATYIATDTVGEAEVTAVTENGVVGTVKLKLVETKVSAKKSTVTVTSGASPETEESIVVSVQLLNEGEIALSGKSVQLKISPSEGIEIESDTVKTDKEGKAELKFTANSKGVKKISIVSGEVELEQTRAVIVKQGQPPLVGDVNGDGTVNIFDLVIAAGQFGQAGDDLKGDVNTDGSVNIFDLVLVAGNFGQSAVTAAPSMVAKIELSTDQKHHIASAIDQLESNSSRSNEEEIALNVLKAILPERLPTQTQLLANYPNPFNPETWIPFQLAQDSIVTVKIYDVTGKQIRIIQLGHLPAGNYVESNRAIYWDGKTETGEQVSSGTYFYQIDAGDYRATRKMVILK